jgi:hypothetical protein
MMGSIFTFLTFLAPFFKLLMSPSLSKDLYLNLHQLLLLLGPSFVIIVVIMIKSSEPGLSNTYRIIRVLSNQDYLATDHTGHRFIFSETTLTSHASIPNSCSPQQALLRHREIIPIDDIQYAVFAVGTEEVVWAPLIRSKRL